jgi:anthranilate phosphoribosyltransferase
MYMTNLAAGIATPEPREDALARLYAGEPLNQAEAETLFGALVQGLLDEPTIAAMLVALRIRGETADELIGAGRALRAADLHFDRPDYLFADSCGTGGDGAGTINLSTAVAFVAAAAGLPVAKHGNRSFTSRCGSADVLEHLGVNIDTSPEASRRSLDEAGICFLFAPQYHPGLKHAGPVRRKLGIRTIMNVLGPCLNPAEPGAQLLGVAEERLLEPVALTLAALGVERAMVVHGSGLDEVALHGETKAVLMRGGVTEHLAFSPEDVGFSPMPLARLQGGGPEENAERLRALLFGYGSAAEKQATALNAGALLFAAGKAESLREGVEQAFRIVGTGAAHRKLQDLIELSHG